MAPEKAMEMVPEKAMEMAPEKALENACHCCCYSHACHYHSFYPHGVDILTLTSVTISITITQ